MTGASMALIPLGVDGPIMACAAATLAAPPVAAEVRKTLTARDPPCVGLRQR